MKQLEFSESFELDYGLELAVVGKWTPARPAPPCSNPDDPRFSDPGDPFEHEITSLALVDGHNRFPLPDVFIERLNDEYFEKELRERLESKEPEHDEPDKYHQSVDDKMDKDVGSWNKD